MAEVMEGSSLQHPGIRYVRVMDLDDEELRIFSKLRESQLLHINEPGPGLFIAESARVILRALDAGYAPVSVLMEEGLPDGEAAEVLARLAERAFVPDDQVPRLDASGRAVEGSGTAAASGELRAAKQIPVYAAPENVLTGITGYRLTRGMLCAMRRRPLCALDAFLQGWIHPEPEAPLSQGEAETVGQCPDGNAFRGLRRIAVLEDVENPTNVGAIFRSAAALGMDGVLLSPGCSDPFYRRAVRVSMGTVFQIPWTFFPGNAGSWPEDGIRALRAAGFVTVAMALTDRSVGIDHPDLRRADKLAVVLGTEGEGLREETIANCDYTVRIPKQHGVDSLNVAAASAVAFWELRRRETLVP